MFIERGENDEENERIFTRLGRRSTQRYKANAGKIIDYDGAFLLRDFTKYHIYSTVCVNS